MKKLVILVLIIAIINLCLTMSVIINFSGSVEDFKINNKPITDTNYNKVLIDSIQYNIIKKDSTIITINNIIKDEINKVDSINDDSAVVLFRQLLQECK